MTFVGPLPDDPEILEALPSDLRRFVEQVNGLVAYDGGLHVRGACLQPEWHSIRHVWRGAGALHALYAAVDRDDVPFAEDAVGDQWLLRGGSVWHLAAETGDLTSLNHTLPEFLAAIERDPVDTLGLHPLLQFRQDGGVLAPGQLLNVYPPFCTAEAAQGVDLAPVPAAERLSFLAELARQIPPEGKFRISVS